MAISHFGMTAMPRSIVPASVQINAVSIPIFREQIRTEFTVIRTKSGMIAMESVLVRTDSEWIPMESN